MQLIKIFSFIAVVLLVTVLFAGLATIPTEAAAAAHESNCQVKYSTWPSSGTTITNEGLGGSAYNGKAVDNGYVVLPSGATAFALNDAADKITVPHGAAINNLNALTHEYIFRLDAQPPGTDPNDMILIGKGDSYGLVINVQWGGVVEIQRYNPQYTAFVRYRWYGANFVQGGWYDLQWSWDCTGFTNVPILKINNVLLTAVDESMPVTGWADDSANDLTLGNYNAVLFSQTLTLFRLHNVALSSAELTDNYNADKWRWGGAGPGWSTWEPLGGQLLAGTGPAAYSWGSARTGWFVTGTNHQLYHSWTGHPGWENLGGYLTSSPAAVSWANGRIDVFARFSDGALYHKWYNGAWSGWESLGGQLAPNTGPAVSSWGAGRLDVFVEGTNGALYHKWYNGAWSSWQNLGGTLTSSPGAVSRQSGVIDVFVRGTTGAVYQKAYYSGAWHVWANIGGTVAAGTGPAASGWTDRDDLFVVGTTSALNQQTWTASTGWSSTWTSLGGQLTSSPAATSPGTGQIAVFGRGTNGALYERTYT